MPPCWPTAFSDAGLSALAKWTGGVVQPREMPRYADQTFTAWFRENRAAPVEGRRVVLWPDTFNNFFRPETAIAATRCLEAAGWQVTIPRTSLCCGRPLYDWGMLDRARAL